MTVTHSQSGTNVHEIADRIYRVNTPVEIPGAGGFSFNQYLILDDEPLLFYTGPRKPFPLVREAVASVLSVDRLRHVAFSHVEADECGSLNDWLRVGAGDPPLTESDILGPSEAFRQGMDYFSHSKHAPGLIERLAATRPTTLACMHGSAWRGDGGALLRALGDALSA